MIIVNGYIQPKIKVQESMPVIDPATGFPRKEAISASWGDKLDCQVIANNLNALARVLGEAKTEQSYTILLEAQPFPYEEIALYDAEGNMVGEFSIISATLLEAVGQLKLII
jgi:hypothetical protein